MAGLSAGQVAALCGNLARGCEKQNLPRESALFAQLAESFTAQVEPIDGADIQGLADLLLQPSQLLPHGGLVRRAVHLQAVDFSSQFDNEVAPAFECLPHGFAGFLRTGVGGEGSHLTDVARAACILPLKFVHAFHDPFRCCHPS